MINDLILQSHVFRQHPHVYRCRVPNRLSRLVKPIVWLLPVVDPSLQEIEQYTVVHLFVVHQLQVVAGPDHVRPKVIVGLELEEAITTPPLFDHKGVIVRLALKSPSILATVEDLQLC